MLTAIHLNIEMAGGRYGDVLKVAERLKNQFGSGNNAIAQMVRQSSLFQDELAKMNSEAKRRPRKRGTAGARPRPDDVDLDG